MTIGQSRAFLPATKDHRVSCAKQMKCGTLSLLVQMAIASTGERRQGMSHEDVIRELQLKYKYSDEDIKTCEEYAQALTELAVSFDVNLWDFTRAVNWGIFNGNPVVLAVGFTKEVTTSHYRK